MAIARDPDRTALAHGGPRPLGVQRLINELAGEAEDLTFHKEQLERVAIGMKELGADTQELVDAAHELDHAWRHVTSARRALVMTWPDVDLTN